MKITQQIIAAAGFASLLFAPLAQAQELGRNVGLTVISDGLTVSGSELNFGHATLNASGVAGEITLNCAAFNVGSPLVPLLGGQVPAGAPAHSNLFTIDDTNAACGNITVTAENDDLTYRLRAEVTALTGSRGGSISPRLSILDANASGTIVAPFTPTSPGFSANQPIAANASTSFTLVGTLPIAASQATEDFTGTYTITALVQTTPTP